MTPTPLTRVFLVLAPLALTPAWCQDAKTLERELSRAFGAIRTERHLDAFQADPALTEIAREHARDMLRRNYFDHRNPEGDEPTDRVGRRHRRLIGLVGENLWTGSHVTAPDPASLADRIASDLMRSPGHRRNILEPEFTHMGVGAAVSGEEIRVVQLFADVDAFLKSDLPARVRPGQILDLSMKPCTGSQPAVRYDVFSPASGKKVAGPVAVTLPFPPAPRGEYILRFYFPDGPQRLKIVSGPSVRTP